MSLNFKQVADYKVSETVELPKLSLSMKPVDAIALAMKKEQQAVEFYTDLANQTNDSSIKQACLELAKMEAGHKNKLEGVYTDIAYIESF
jgi:rubrerythrin